MNDDVEQAVNLGLELVLLSTRAQVRCLLDGQAFELDGLGVGFAKRTGRERRGEISREEGSSVSGQ